MDFIEIYKKTLPTDICKEIISYFDTYSDQTFQGQTKEGLNIKDKDSTDLELTKLKGKVPKKVWKTLADNLRENIADYVLKYPLVGGDVMEWNETDAKTTLWTGFSIFPFATLAKKYKKGKQGYHVWHGDQGRGIPNIFRQLVCMYYLNDVKKGGETEFYHQNMKIKPEQGSLVIFPAFFTHLHKGHVPTSGDKYILNFWLMSGAPDPKYLEAQAPNYFYITKDGYV